MGKKKSKIDDQIDDQITKARNADASWLKIFMEKMGQARLNNKADDMIQEAQNAEAVCLKKFLEKARQETQEWPVATETRLAHLCGMANSL